MAVISDIMTEDWKAESSLKKSFLWREVPSNIQEKLFLFSCDWKLFISLSSEHQITNYTEPQD